MGKNLRLAIGMWLGFCAAMWGQTTTGRIVGTITDGSGAAVAGARVEATNQATGLRRETSTNESGDFVLPLLEAGNYQLAVQKQGFRSAKQRDVVLNVAGVQRVDFQLPLGDVKETVEVTAEPPAIQSDSAALGTLVNQRAVQDLPLNGRNYVNLVRLAAGANEGVQNALSSGNRGDDRRRGSSVSVNGQHDVFNNSLIDGIDNNERFIGTVIVKPSVEALAEFRVITSAYSAEFGRTSGGVINLVTKSGGNEFHGSLFEFFRNEALDARNFFATSGPKPRYRQNQFGGSIGGPIRKNRTFFFGDYERLKIAQGITYANNVPTAAMKQGNFGGVNPVFDPATQRVDPARPGVTVRDRFPNDTIPATRQDPVAARLSALYPDPNGAGLANNFVYSPDRTQRDDTFDARVDHMLSARQTIYGRYSFNDVTTFIPSNLPPVNGVWAGGDAAAGDSRQRAQGLHLNYVLAARPNLLIEAKAAYSRFANRNLNLNYGKNVSQDFGLNGVNFDDESSGLSIIAPAGFRQLGDVGFTPTVTVNNVFQYLGNVSYISGGHTIKTGGDLRRRQVSPFQSPTARGQFNFNANLTNDPTNAVARSGNSYASFLLGLPNQTTRSKYLVVPGIRTIETAFFFQDDWKVSKRLTLNLGVRYEYFSPFTEVADRISNVDLRTGKIIQAGRDGVSRSAGVPRDFNNWVPRFGFAYTLGSQTVLRGGFGMNYYALHFGTISAMRNPPFVSLLQLDTTPLQANNRLRDGLPAPTPVSATNPNGALTTVSQDTRNPYVYQYNLSLQQGLPGGFVMTAGYVGVLGRKQYFSYNVNQAEPGPGAVQARRPFVSLFPNVQNIGMAGSWGNSAYQGLQSTVERRLRNGFNFQANYTWAHVIDDYSVIGGGKPGSGPFPQLASNRKIERGNSDLDIRQRMAAMLNYELPFWRQAKGLRGAALGGWQVNGVLTLQTGVWFTVQNNAAQSNTGSGDRPNVLRRPSLSGDNRSLARWFDTGAFAVQPLYTVGNTGRNTLEGPGRKQLDFSLFKNFAVAEKKTLQFRAEFFNVTNTPNFGVPGNSLGAANFGVIGDTGASLPRNLQFALKFLF